ncbi:MAG: PAS domain S-box protein [Spirochaetota bacterium]
MSTRILIADSERETAARCGKILGPLGYEIRTVSGPIDAVIAAIEADRPDLVLMDITIPVNGIGIEAARSIGRRFDLPLIYLAGDAGAETVSRARETGPYGYILKPVKDHDLISNIDSALHRHQLERELRESELKFRTLTEHNNAPVYVIQGERFVYVNNAFTRLLEYSADECYNMAFWEVMHPDYRELTRERGLARQRGVRVPDRYEVKLLTRSERTLWAELSVALIEYQGRPASLGTAIDITGRKMAEEALRHSEEQYRLLVENANEAIAVFQDLTIRFANRKMSEATGYPIDELIGRSFLDLIHPEDRELVVQNHLKRIQGQDLPGVYSFRVVTKGGEVKWAEINTAFIDWEGKTAVLSFLTDVTERKMMEEEIRRHNQRLEYLLTVAKIGIDIIDEDYNILYIDPAWSKIYGKPDGRKCHEYFMDRAAPCDNCGVPEAIAGRRTVIKEEVLVKENNRIVEVHTIPFEEGGRTLAAEFNIDVTERKRLEQQLVHAQKMESVGRLAGGIAHDFNNILQAIIGLSHIALSESAANRTSTEELEQILAASRRATALVKQLLAFSSRQTMRCESLDLNAIIDEMSGLLRRIIGEHIELRTESAADLWSVYADPGQVEQIIMNLCVNSRDAMPDGGSILISTTNVRISPDTSALTVPRAKGDYVMLLISDTGTGMEKEVSEHVFEPFFTTKETGKGTGLGLATVYGIVKQHEGWIELESSAETGTVFRIYLPASREPSPHHSGKSETAERPARGAGTILLAEDDELVRTMAVKVLRKAGYRVLTAVDGIEAVELFRREGNGIDLFILDIVMPRMSGLDACDRIRAENPVARVILSSGYSEEGLDRERVKGMLLFFIQKPYDPSEFLDLVRRAIDAGTDEA